MAELLSYRFHEEIDFIMEGPVGRLHSMADEVAALEQQNASLQQRVEALERFVRAHDALEEGIANLELHNSTAQELWAARKAIGLIAAAQEVEGHEDV